MINLLIAGLVVTWVGMAALLWLVVQLTQQNGRLMLRMDELETARPAGGGAPAAPSGLPRGSAAPDFELTDLDGGDPFKLSEQRGKDLLLIFWGPRCGYCQRMAPDLALAKPNGEGPIPIVISGGSVDASRASRDEHGITARWLHDPQGEVMRAFASTGTPTGYIIDEQGRIATELIVGAPPLLRMLNIKPSTDAPAAAPPANRAQRRAQRGNKSLEESKIRRDGLPAGSPAPDFTLERADQTGEISLSDYRGRKVLLVFTSPNCGPCEALLPQLQRLGKMQSNVEMLLIGRGDANQNRLKAQMGGVTIPLVVQQRWEVSKAYGIFATPIAFLVDENGVIAEDVATGYEGVLELAGEAITEGLVITAGPKN